MSSLPGATWRVRGTCPFLLQMRTAPCVHARAPMHRSRERAKDRLIDGLAHGRIAVNATKGNAPMTLEIALLSIALGALLAYVLPQGELDAKYTPLTEEDFQRMLIKRGLR